MNDDGFSVAQTVLIVIYVAASLGAFVYFFQSLLVSIPSALWVSSQLVLELQLI